MKIKELNESTTSGSIAPGTPAKVGKMQKRAGSLFKGKVTNKPFYEGKVKDLDIDLKELSDKEFLAKYKKSKEEMREALKEDEITEQDLIVLPGMRRMKDKSFIPHEADRRDHEVEMARSDLYAAAKNAMRIFQLLKDRTEDEGLMGWQQSYITLASDYLNSVADSIEYDQQMNEVLGGVIAGGMSNFEEGLAEGHTDQVKKVFKKNGKPVGEVGIDPEASPGNGQWYMKCYAYDIDNAGYDSYEEAVEELKYCLKQGMAEGAPELLKKEMPLHRHAEKLLAQNGVNKDDPDYHKHLANTISHLRKFGNIDQINKQGVAESKCPECGGPAFSEEHIAEAKDACYNKVKSRYKVWPSAYASGALVKCRKVGASNWGNKSKK